MRLSCECNNIDCPCEADLTDAEAQARNEADLILICNGCQRGPEKTDVLVEQRDGYRLYREGEG